MARRRPPSTHWPFNLKDGTPRLVGQYPAPFAWADIVRRDPCAYCVPFAAPIVDAMTLEHVRPRVRGGAKAWTNIVGAHGRCNTRRNDRPILAFLLEQRRLQLAGGAWTRGARRAVLRARQ